MSYAVDITPEAARDLSTLPPHVAQFVEAQLTRLAADPVTLSIPSHFPYPVGGQAFRFELETPDVHYFFHVVFKYSADEQWIHVLLIGVQRIGSEDL